MNHKCLTFITFFLCLLCSGEAFARYEPEPSPARTDDVGDEEAEDAEISRPLRFKKGHLTTYRVRTLLAPTAFTLEPGEGYVSQKELLYSSFSLGITEHISAYGGTVIPLFFTRQPNLIAGVKVGGQVSERLHLAVGLGAGVHGDIRFGFFEAGGALTTTVTYGTPTSHITFNLAAAFIDGYIPVPLPIATASVYKQINPKLGFLCEGWVTLGAIAPVIGGRYTGDKWNIDLGVAGIFAPDAAGGLFPFIPLPVIDITRNFHLHRGPAPTPPDAPPSMDWDMLEDSR